MTLDELEAIDGTPEFEEEYRRQIQATAACGRNSSNNTPIEPDWGSLELVWKSVATASSNRDG